MYAYFKGELIEKYEDSIVIETGNIGYNIAMCSNDISALSPIGSNVKIFTYTLVKEDALSLFGFIDKDELDLFKMLITVSGVGPKSALSILSALGVNGVVRAIAMGEHKLIAKAQGVGSKTAERVIIDLKDKVNSYMTLSMIDGESDISVNKSGTEVSNDKCISTSARDAISALVVLGYSEKEAQSAVLSVKSENEKDLQDTDYLLKNALLYL